MRKVIAIVGTTASGKSDFAVALAKYLGVYKKDFGITGAEIISADSRQVYKGLDIGSGKITQREMGGIVHHMLDIASPMRTYTVAHYQKQARKILEKLFKERKVPIVCGGTGLYVDALLKNIHLPQVPPNQKLRNRLEKMETKDLFLLLKKADPARARHIDAHNRRRLVRALEIATYMGTSPKIKKQRLLYHTCFIGITLPDKILHKRIYNRLLKRMRAGMVGEARKLHAQGLSWERMERFGLEYRCLSKYLQKSMTKQEMIEQLFSEIKKYTKRQMTWFKRNKDIHWLSNPTPSKIIEIAHRYLAG